MKEEKLDGAKEVSEQVKPAEVPKVERDEKSAEAQRKDDVAAKPAESKLAAQESKAVAQEPAAKKAKKCTGFKIFTSIFLFSALGLSAASFVLTLISLSREDAQITLNGFGSDGNTASFVEGSIAEVAARVAPSVVSIITETRTQNMFGQTSAQTSAGTGMIVTADGYILTNNHVVEGAREIQVMLDDGTTYKNVKLVGTDGLNDVAFLKIGDVNNLPAVVLGDSKTLSVGQQVIAIGNALGQYQNTVTAGIISGMGRSLTAYGSNYSSETLNDMIQTDAAVNSGNSGGPLVNAAGEVIGINTATGIDADGVSFAIPISAVKGMFKNIVQNGAAERAYAGVRYVSLTPDVAATYELPVSVGAYIYSNSDNGVIAGSPAEKAGLLEGDIVTKVNGIAIGKAGSLGTLLGEYAPGDTVQLVVLRGGKEHTLNLTLEAYKD